MGFRFLIVLRLQCKFFLNENFGLNDRYRDDLVWAWWPQVEKPWTPAELEYIKKIDLKSDIEQLSRHFKFRDVKKNFAFFLCLKLSRFV